jgi:deoxyribodipyrimidine photo-lyase
MHIGIIIFRRDLRIVDNTALIAACSECDIVYPIFILDNRQIKKSENKYFSYNAFSFMLESLIELKQLLKKSSGNLTIFKGDLELIIKKVIKKVNVKQEQGKPTNTNTTPSVSLFVNADYTPFSRKRDSEIKTICDALNVNFVSCHDIPLNHPEKIKPYKVFTPYYRVASLIKVDKPKKLSDKHFKKISSKEINLKASVSISDLQDMLSYTSAYTAKLRQTGGRSQGIKILKKVKNLKYAEDRNYPSRSTTRLSAHIKFGTLSIREIYYFIKLSTAKSEPLIRQLYWRDFYIQIAFHFPHVFGNNFRTNFKWKPADPAVLNKWKTGNTGIKFIDAGMRELLHTGFMHNRLRMITANALVYIFKIDWREGEMHFAQHLTDYDPCNNNGGWQWSAGTGADANPYYRVFNPDRQAKIWDKDNEYINRWLNF